MSQLRIIIEGEEGSGKTSLLKFLASVLEEQAVPVRALDQRRVIGEDERLMSLPWTEQRQVTIMTRTPREARKAWTDGEQGRRGAAEKGAR